ncbi:unnamed protein product [Bemisia tabaci]|uniref:Uncharacterized protein n=1 Tax=Bemisia tabaci TaxID=7038 RepID=A0A9P0A0F8_BEMTA|nr:unnamed protein product [Bemisia tabaci]
MFYKHYIVIWTLLTQGIYIVFPSTQTHQDSLTSLAFKVCRNTVLQSKLTLFYIVDLNSSPSVPPLIHLLHNFSVHTILINRPRGLTELTVSSHRKNAIFFLNNVGELMNLVLHSAPNFERFETATDRKKSTPGEVLNMSLHADSSKFDRWHSARKLPRYCFQVDDSLLETHTNETCDERVRMTSDELEDIATLSKSTFDLTRRLYRNKIWNANNHLIFMLQESKSVNLNTRHGMQSRRIRMLEKKNSTEVYDADTVNFSLKFFWRFFRGIKTVICDFRGCKKFDPFRNSIIFYDGKEGEAYFEFSWRDMHNKSVKFLLSMIGGKDGIENGVLWSHWETFFVEVLNRLKKSLNCHFDPQMIHLLPAVANPNLQDNLEINVGQKYGVAIHVINFAKVLKGTNPSDFDFSVCFDTTALSVLTPPSKLVPQYFLLFRVFTPVVWIFIIMTTIAFVLMQYIFQYSQRGQFRQLYSETTTTTVFGLTCRFLHFCAYPARGVYSS